MFFAAIAALALHVTPGKPLVDLGRVGSVSLPTGCKAAVQPDFDRALALLHSFFYDEARLVFGEVLEKDPGCAIAEWGVAMTYYHPIWAPPLPEDRTLGRAASQRAVALGGGKTPVERGLIHALEAYWMGGASPSSKPGVPSCHGGAPSAGGGAEAFRDELAKLHGRFGKDVEVTSFYALSLLGTAPKEDRTLAQQRKAAALLEAVRVQHPDHPGVIHYLIHAYDYPETAKDGLGAARAYAAIAPAVPHALHMPSHIFVRLGMWKDDVDSNLLSLAAAQRWSAVRHPGTTFSDALHASDYLLYGYLQQGRDDLADAEVLRMAAVKEVYPPREQPAAVARAVAPVRAVLERERWADAAKLEVQPIVAFEAYPFVRGFVEYAHALGAVHTGNLAGARESAAKLATMTAAFPPALGYWATLFESYRQATLGWVAHAEKHDAEAVTKLGAAADLEDRIGPHPVLPGPLLPAREQLGDLLLELGRSREALAAYHASDRLYPGRLRTAKGEQRARKSP